MPPTNDRWANAKVITGIAGDLTQSNVGATTEAVEPGRLKYNPTGTTPTPNTGGSILCPIWFSWTCPVSGTYVFSTNKTSLSQVVVTNFPSVIQAFTVGGGNLFEVTYVLNESCGSNGMLENAAQVAFIATAGTTYLVRVASRYTQNGTVYMHWNTFNMTRLGSCSTCPPQSDGACVGTLQIADVTRPWNGSFGTNLPRGIYEVRYCQGAYVYYGVPTNQWTVSISTSGEPNVNVYWPEGGTTMAGTGSWPDQPSAEFAAVCNRITFATCGGNIHMTFVDYNYDDNINGKPNPTFQLIDISKTFDSTKITENISGCVLSGTNPNWTLVFGIKNAYAISLPITATLLNSGGISGASAAQNITLTPGNNTVTFTFSADIQNNFCTASLQLSVCGIVLTTLGYPLYPIPGAPTLTGHRSFTDGTCGNLYEQDISFPAIPSCIPTYGNGGQVGGTQGTDTCDQTQYSWGISYKISVSPLSMIWLGGTVGSCTDCGTLPFAEQINGPGSRNLYFVRPIGAPVTETITVTVTCGNLVYPPYTFSITIPT